MKPEVSSDHAVSPRRLFLKTAVISGTAATIYPALGAARSFAAPSTASAPEVPAFELDEVTVSQLQSDLESKKYTAHSLAEKYLRRIEEVDKDGPAVNSVIEVNPDALSIADELDKDRAAKG